MPRPTIARGRTCSPLPVWDWRYSKKHDAAQVEYNRPAALLDLAQGGQVLVRQRCFGGRQLTRS
jgi:hypothetical protein